jgi:hypothetical protein
LASLSPIWELQNRGAGLLSCEFAARRLVQARQPTTRKILIDVPTVLNRADAINNLSGSSFRID